MVGGNGVNNGNRMPMGGGNGNRPPMGGGNRPPVRNAGRPVTTQRRVSRMMIEPDKTGATMRARRRGFIGTVKTTLNPFEQNLYIFDESNGVRNFCMGNVAVLDRTPNKKKFPPNVYRVYNLRALGIDGDDALSLFYGGKRQTLRFVGHIPKQYVIHDKFVFRVRYSKQLKSWQYLDPISNTFRGLPFEPTQLVLYKEDVKNYRGDIPARVADGSNNLDNIIQTHIPAAPQRVGTPQRVGAPQTATTPPLPKVEVRRFQPTPQRSSTDSFEQMDTDAPNLYVLKVRYTDMSDKVVGYGVVTPNGEKKKFGVNKVIELARQGKVRGVKAVNRGSGEFLQGVGQSIDSLPTKKVSK